MPAEPLSAEQEAQLNARVAGPSQMTNGEVETFFRRLYNDLLGKGFVDGATLNRLLYEWFFGSPAQAYIDFMQNCGGDGANVTNASVLWQLTAKLNQLQADVSAIKAHLNIP